MNIYLLSLCLIQGITEFLPVSSSGHLKLLGLLVNFPKNSLEWEVALHLGTLFAVVIYSRQVIKGMVLSVLVPRSSHPTSLNNIQLNYPTNPDLKLMIHLVVATIPAVVVGYIVKPYLASLSTVTIIGFSSIFFGILLGIGDLRPTPHYQPINLYRAFLIGCAQTLAFIPGASRFGVCVTAARFLDIDRTESTKFAFLLSIPTVLAAVTLVSYDLVKQQSVIDFKTIILTIIVTSAIGFGAMHGILKFIKRYSFQTFMIYRVILGIILLGLSFFS